MSHHRGQPCDPADVRIDINCGAILFNSDTHVAQLGLHVLGTGEAHMTLSVADDRDRATVLYFGLREWKEFKRAIAKLEGRLGELMMEGKVDEVTPCPPG